MTIVVKVYNTPMINGDPKGVRVLRFVSETRQRSEKVEIWVGRESPPEKLVVMKEVLTIPNSPIE